MSVLKPRFGSNSLSLSLSPSGGGGAGQGDSSDESAPAALATDDVAGHHRAMAEEENEDDEGPFVDEAPELIADAPMAVSELAAACVRFVAARYGVMPDFTSETLSLVDQYVSDARKEGKERPETFDLVAGSIGAYLGEVIRRTYGGTWFADGDHDGWRLQMSRVFLSFNPIGMAREALLLATQEGWSAHLTMEPAEREEVERRLAALPEVSENEYYAPTTRFDVIALAHDTLRAQMNAAGHGDVRFDESDYR